MLPFETFSDVTYHASPTEAVTAYSRYQKRQSDAGGAVPAVEVAPAGYDLAVSDNGRSAVLRSGVMEIDAAKEEQGWRIALIRVCGNYQPPVLPAPATASEGSESPALPAPASPAG